MVKPQQMTHLRAEHSPDSLRAARLETGRPCSALHPPLKGYQGLLLLSRRHHSGQGSQGPACLYGDGRMAQQLAGTVVYVGGCTVAAGRLWRLPQSLRQTGDQHNAQAWEALVQAPRVPELAKTA